MSNKDTKKKKSYGLFCSMEDVEKTFYQLADIDEKSLLLEIFRNTVQKCLSGVFWFLLLRRTGLRGC